MDDDERYILIAFAGVAFAIGFVLMFRGLRAAFGDVVADFSIATGLFAAAIAAGLEIRR